jgi:CheY-like chemotaxis protein
VCGAVVVSAVVPVGDSTTAESDPPLIAVPEVVDDRGSIKPGEKVLLIIEDDVAFAPLLMELAHKKGFKAIIATRGDKGIALARELKPDAITLDIRLPDMAGWLVLSRLKYDPTTRHIPVHVISMDEDYRRGLSLGAESYLEKTDNETELSETFDKISVSTKPGIRHLLLLDSDETRRSETATLIGEGRDVIVTVASSAEEAMKALDERVYDCAIVSPMIPDMPLSEFVATVQKQRKNRELPVIIFKSGPITRAEQGQVKQISERAVVKIVWTAEKLLEETAVFLNRREEDLTDEQKQMIEKSRQRERVLAGGKVLIVDDDVRNIFALTSGLERHKLEVMYAESGKAGIEMLKKHPEVDVVLMDIMMPEMDGYETIRSIRQLPELRNLPIIALTAKAMKGDREKCIDAGASDYIPKPVILEDLISLLQVWLPVHNEHPPIEASASNDR